MILKKLYSRIVKRNDTIPFKIDEGHSITKAFIADGVQYYQMHDVFNTFCARAMDALSIYEEWQMRCSRDFLKLHTKAIDDILRDPKKINIIDIAELNTKLKERLDWALPTEDIIWRFMAVAYFDESESPYKYDNKYGEEKIKRWKEGRTIEDFFLFVPIRDLIPLPDFSKADLSLLLTMIEKLDAKHLEFLTSKLSLNQQSSDLLTRYRSAKSSVSTLKN
jgi:hypothetical protein